MNQSYYPSKNSEAILWLTNYKNQIGLQGPALGLVAAQISNEQSACQKIIDAINDIEAKKAIYTAAVANLSLVEATFLTPLKTEIAHYKTNPGYTASIGEILRVIGTSQVLDEANYKCKFKVELFGGFVRIKFVKAGVDGVNIYHRQKGQLEWNFLARDTKSPYDDHIVLQTAGQPEHWEYQLFGVINDNEIGLASDIIEVVYGG